MNEYIDMISGRKVKIYDEGRAATEEEITQMHQESVSDLLKDIDKKKEDVA